MLKYIEKLWYEGDLMIFDEIKPNKNDLLTSMSTKDLIYIINLINSFYLALRNNLKVNDSTFGLEIEFNSNFNKQLTIQTLDIEFFNHNFKGYSLTEDCEKIEVNSGILMDKKQTWMTLKEVLSLLKIHGNIASNCSGHVNIGTQILETNNNNWLNFILLWACYEDIIFRFTSGEWKSIRRRVDFYAKPVGYKYIELYNKIQEEIKKNPKFLSEYDTRYLIYDINTLFTKYFSSKDRNNAVNLFKATNPQKCELNNIIEFRCPNSSLDTVIWQNNINFLIKFLNYCKSPNFNYEIVLKRLNKFKKQSSLEYNSINLNKAIELADLIFDNNLDKVYFLRQYLKNFATSKNEDEKAKQFTINS